MMTSLYEFRLDGQLTDQAREAFCDMRIEEITAGATLYGEVIDESHLLGIMAQCRTLGLVVVSAQRMPSGIPPDPEVCGGGHTVPPTGGSVGRRFSGDG
jgi:hypothetical protein